MTAIALVQKVQNLPPVSEAALKLISLLDKSAVDNNDIVQVLKYDNVLTAKLLRECNSAARGLEEPVSSVDQAVLILGHEQILHIVMTLAFGSVMTGSTLTYTMEMSELWQHSLMSAVAADIILKETPELEASPNVGFTASLLHDIGKLVLAQAISAEEIAEIRDRIERKQISGTQAEKEVLGIDHGEAGAALLQSWRLPESIVEAVANHHQPGIQARQKLSTLTHVANAMAHHAKPPAGQTIHDLQVDNKVATSLKLDDKKLDDMTVTVRDSFERVDMFMAMA
jgi:putative nucleotidyltransferase with HDIG domain